MIKLDEKTIHDNCTEIYKCLSPHSDVYGIRAGSKGRIEGIFWWWGKAWFWIKDLFTCGAQTRKVDEAVKITFENMKGQLETSPYSCFFYVDRRPSFFDILIDGHWGPGDCEDPPGPDRRSYSALTKRMLTSKSFQKQKLEIDRLASEINTIISNG
ncbi:MAG: hypothetical protein K940chlam7_00980 [Chlamydiae bacterium]|nr:hypothetical protein [Chlamydiota bacterium]